MKAVNFGVFLSPLNIVAPVEGLRYSPAESVFWLNFPKPEIDTVPCLETAFVNGTTDVIICTFSKIIDNIIMT